MERLSRHRAALGMSAAAAGLLTALLGTGCGGVAGIEVSDGSYTSFVPSAEQIAADIAGALPGGVHRLREAEVERIHVEISGDQVTIRLDGIDAATSTIIDRVEVTDSEGSGPFKAKKQILILDGGPLELRGLVIDEPVVWPGSFEESPVITIKPRDPAERGPGVSCAVDEACLLLSSGMDPAGAYADANNPEREENPIDTILIGDDSVKFELDAGETVTVSTDNGSVTRACGLSENKVWDLPDELGLAIADPVLVHTLCPSTPGASIQLSIMDASAIPLLAPLTEAREGDWCTPGPACLIFVPT